MTAGAVGDAGDHRWSLRPAAIASRYGRTRAAVTMGTKRLRAEAKQSRILAAVLHAVEEVLAGAEAGE